MASDNNARRTMPCGWRPLAVARSLFRDRSFARVFSCMATLIVAGGCNALPNTNNVAGVRLYQQGQYAAAMQQFQQALLAEPRNADAYYNLAASYHRVGTAQQDRQSLSQAENLYNQCLDRDENHTDCHRGLAVLLVETERSDRAFALMQNWAARNPRSSEARVELARLYEEFGDAETAKTNLQTAVQLDQANARAWAALGRLRERAGDAAQALANYQRSLQLNRQQPALAERVAFLQSRVPANFYGAPPGTSTAAAPSALWSGAPSTGAPWTGTQPFATQPFATQPFAASPSGFPSGSAPAGGVPAGGAPAGGAPAGGAPAGGGAVGGTNPRTVQGLPVPPRY
jgi:tetratricopeptide (TPR) repeat protein